MKDNGARKAAMLLVELGRVEYGRALRLQRELVELRLRDDIPDTLVLLEHPPVITVGRNADRSNLLVVDAELERRGVRLFRAERGGDITYHGPGQLVGYPVFRLSSGTVGVRRFVDLVQEALVAGLAELGVSAGTRPGLIGVWVGGEGRSRKDEVPSPQSPVPNPESRIPDTRLFRKIASIGVAVRRGVTFHGFALNVSTDLSWFELMNPCGLAQVRMTSVGKEGGATEPDGVAAAIVEGFERAFGRRVQRNLPRSLTSLTNGLSRTAISSARARE